MTYMNNAYYATIFFGFLYICANPFIYGVKFDPVRRVLKGLILCRSETQPASESNQAIEMALQ